MEPWFIRRTMENFNYPVSKIGCDDKIMQTRRQLDEVMGMMRANIEKLSERSEKLEDLASRAEVLDMSSQEFQRCAGEVRRKKLWKAYATKAVILGFVGITVISTIGSVFRYVNQPGMSSALDDVYTNVFSVYRA
ncbi:Synaptobrevin [Ancylostoma caninum]|uniref:Synaptobrevin n=1 Tax=Ancylostoma caninum TaxID=29170 RepID=A0A368G835_ANCCA|nr:Synaptobrevin [Ancylostoma caninum]